MINSQSLNHRGIPWLMRLPIFGAFFRNHQKATQLNEMVLYITPHIYLGDEGSPEFIQDKSILDHKLPKERERLFRRNKKSQQETTMQATPAGENNQSQPLPPLNENVQEEDKTNQKHGKKQKGRKNKPSY